MVVIVNFVTEIYSILFRYRRCRCRTLLYLPCIFRLRTETIWVSATLRILILPKSTALQKKHPTPLTIVFRYYFLVSGNEVFYSSVGHLRKRYYNTGHRFVKKNPNFHGVMQHALWNEMATISTLFDSGLTVWPKDMIVQSHTENIDNFGFWRQEAKTCLSYRIFYTVQWNHLILFLLGR